MSYDLSRALQQAADRAVDPRPDMAAAPVLARLHRRRVVRTTTTSAVGAAAAAAIALGGLQLAERQEAPPADPTRSVTTTPSPSLTPSPAPTPVVGAELPGCGESTAALAPTTGAFAGDPEVVVGSFDESDQFLPAGYGDVVAATVRVVNTSGATQEARAVGDAEVVVARDDVVVATLTGDPYVPMVEGEVQDGAELAIGSVLTALESCTDGAVLEPGDYALWARTVVETAEPGETPEEVTVVHPVVPFTVFAEGDPASLGPVTWTPDGAVDPTTGDPVTEPPVVTAPAAEDLALGYTGILELVDGGLGEAGLRLGEELTGTESANPLVEWDPDRCVGTDLPGRWVAAYDEVEMVNGMPGSLFKPLVLDGRVVRIDVYGAEVDVQGAGVGSTWAELEAAAGFSLLRDADENGLRLFGYDGEGGLVVAEVADESVSGDVWDDEVEGTVVAMSVLPSEDYSASTYQPAWGGDSCG